MSQIKHYVVAAGAVFGLATVAAAQNGLDYDRAYSAELNADAAARTSQLQGGNAGNDGFFYVSDGTGNYRLNMSGLLQFRYTVNLRDDQPAPAGPDDDTTIGFSLPRTQLRWHGNIINPNWKFYIQGDFGDASNNGTFNLQYAYGQYDFENMEGGFLRFGQFKLPILAEELVAPEFQLAAERSVTNEFFSQQYSQGLMFGYMSDAFAIHAAFSDGVGSANTAFNSGNRSVGAASPLEADWAFTARADVKFEGDWERFDDFTSWRGDDRAARIGGAVHWEEANNTNPSAAGNADYELLEYTIDGAVEGNGWNLYAAFIGANSELGAFEADDFGAIVQGGVFLAEQWELFGRWDALFIDDATLPAGADEDLHFLTFGVNYYFVPMSHAAKFTLDTVWSLNTTGPAIASRTAVGSTATAITDPRLTQVLGDGDDGEFVLRAQIQLAF